MGRFERPAPGGITKYYWYPGDIGDWRRALVAGGSGLLTIILVSAITRDPLAAAVLGTSVTAAIAGFGFGRKDVRALHSFTRFAVGCSARACWRALVKGFGAAAAAVLVVHSARGGGFVATWLLPVVPAVIGAFAHQAGMLIERASAAHAAPVATAPVAAAQVAAAVEAAPYPGQAVRSDQDQRTEATLPVPVG